MLSARLKLRRKSRGATLIELMIGIVIVAVLMAVAIPNFTTWISNSQIRTSAQAIENGLQMARAEAVRRNVKVQFSLTNSLDNACAVATDGKNWVVSLSDPTSLCGGAPSMNVTSASPAPQIIQARPGAAGSSKAVVAADQASVIFNGMGQASTALNVCVGINSVDPANCYLAADVTEKHMKVTVTTGGQVRVCDPKWTVAQDPQGC